MAYSSGGRLPYESASKLGHLNVIGNDWVRSILEDLETNDLDDDSSVNQSMWHNFAVNSATPLEYLWAADGSYSNVHENHKEVAFVKTALMAIEQSRIDKIDKDYPHPLLMQELMKDSAVFHATVFPLKNLKSDKGSIYDTVRHIIYDSIRVDEGGQYFETLKWLSYKKWRQEEHNSPSFECPCCGKELNSGFPFDSDTMPCPFCSEEIMLTDMLGFHLDMAEDSAPETVASMYMLIMETLMLFTIIRLQWENRDKSIVTNTLFIKDGPMTLKGQYSKLVPNIREFLKYSLDQGRPIHIISSEKSGKFFEHLSLISRHIHTEENQVKYAVLDHGYIRREIQRSSNKMNPYGKRTNWGEKVYVVIDNNTHFIINVPTGSYRDSEEYPTEGDIIGLDRILATLPSLISRKYEGALYPVELVNGIASLSDYPSSKILQDFTRDLIR